MYSYFLWRRLYRIDTPASFLRCALVYFGIMTYIVLGILRERKPMQYYFGAAVLFVLSQLDFFLLNKVICRVSNPRFEVSVVCVLTKGYFLELKLESGWIVRRDNIGDDRCRRFVPWVEKYNGRCVPFTLYMPEIVFD